MQVQCGSHLIKRLTEAARPGFCWHVLCECQWSFLKDCF